VRPGNYAVQAATYDATRRASPTVLDALREALGLGGGRLLDVAGGTGNYAAALTADGFLPTVADAEPAMLVRAAAKLGAGTCVAADAGALPFADGSFDRAICVSAFHLFADKAGALREIRRVLRAGPFAMQAFTRENLRPLFLQRYFANPMQGEVRETEDQHVRLLRAAGFTQVETRRLVYRGVEDGSLSALQTDPELAADEAHLRNTSYWQRMDPADRRQGLERLATDLRSGVLAAEVERGLERARRWGHTTLFVARP
jgi:ubiquinone/menaquinone biosynthesis C-methylase UbiE